MNVLPGARTRVSDYLWGLVAATMTVVLLRQVVVRAAALVRSPTVEQLLDFLLVALLSALAGRWLAGGAWRRTVWGAPVGGVREYREHRLEASATPSDASD